MNAISSIRTLLRGTLLAACIPALALPALAAGTAAGKNAHATQTMPAALRPVFYQALVKDAGAAYQINKNGCAVLPKQPLKACFDNDGAHFTLPAGQAGGTTPLSLQLAAYGRSDKLTAVEAVKPAIEGNRVSYRHGVINEWWRVLPIGFEQGFTIAKRPSGHSELMLALAMSTPDAGVPTIRHSGAGRNPVKNGIPATVRDANSHWIPASAGMTTKKNDGTLAWGKLRYGQLVVTDARGKVVRAALTSKGDRVLITVNDVHAVYPLTVDPLVWLEQKVTASDGTANDGFGISVAVSGTTALIGADGVNEERGAAYVFSESNGSWTQTALLTASDGESQNYFGSSVALDGTTALVGALYATIGGNFQQGAAYVFNESDGTWIQAAKLTASDGGYGYTFGNSVALDGSTALVGDDNDPVNGNSGQGAAYVFSESGGIWTQVQKLTASDGAAHDDFGVSVSLNGDGTIALVGADCAPFQGSGCGPGAAYVFDGSSGTWTQTQQIVASDGTNGAYFGTSVALDGTTALVGALGSGAAYMFTNSGGTWTQIQKLVPNDSAAQFGSSIALTGATALIGARVATVNGNSAQGAAYVFTNSGGTWTQTAKLTASDGAAGDEFGTSVALDGMTALAGAPSAAVNGHSYQGAAYFYGQSDLGLAVSAPETVGQGQNYTSQTIATNNTSAASPAVTATIAVPTAASFISAMASQGSCSEDSGVVSCDLGAIDGNAGTATANVTLKATGAPGTVIHNVAGIVNATPPLTASAPTTITGGQSCPDGYTTYSGTLAADASFRTPSYAAPAGEENAILYAPAGFKLGGRVDSTHHGPYQRVFSGTEVHRWGPEGTYTWGVKANDAGGAYTLCISHP